MHTQTDKNRELGTRSVGRLLVSLAVPAITAQIINVLYNVVDRMYLGHIEGIGSQALTGVGVTMPLITAISAFAMLASMGGAPRASILLGRGDRAGAERVLGELHLSARGDRGRSHGGAPAVQPPDSAALWRE